MTYGINFRSPLNDLSHFHVANAQLPQDVMHVLLRMSICYIHITSQTICSMNGLTAFIILLMKQETSQVQFIWRTPFISQVRTQNLNSLAWLIQTLATQMWILKTYLPLMIGDKVPEEDERSECFLLLLDITQICTSRIISKECANYLSGLILDHHQQFRKYPSASITPKFHYMVHFGKQILR